MHLQRVRDEIIWRAFPTTLKRLARVWINKIAPNSVSTLKELSRLFLTHFIRGQWYKWSLVSLLNVKQQDDESLRPYVTRFNMEALLINKADNKVLVTYFTNGLWLGGFLFSIYKNNPKTMAYMLYWATKYMNAKNPMIAKRGGPKKREKHDNPHLRRGRKAAWTNDKRDERRSRPLLEWVTNFPPFNTLLN